MAEATSLPIQRDIERLVARLQDAPEDGTARRQLLEQGLAPVWGCEVEA
jgi:hypothetical protein